MCILLQNIIGCVRRLFVELKSSCNGNSRIFRNHCTQCVGEAIVVSLSNTLLHCTHKISKSSPEKCSSHLRIGSNSAFKIIYYFCLVLFDWKLVD